MPNITGTPGAAAEPRALNRPTDHAVHQQLQNKHLHTAHAQCIRHNTPLLHTRLLLASARHRKGLAARDPAGRS
ncbi:hypothetical protein ACFL3V_06800 [Nanoarchaeota archaeon]